MSDTTLSILLWIVAGIQAIGALAVVARSEVSGSAKVIGTAINAFGIVVIVLAALALA